MSVRMVETIHELIKFKKALNRDIYGDLESR